MLNLSVYLDYWLNKSSCELKLILDLKPQTPKQGEEGSKMTWTQPGKKLWVIKTKQIFWEKEKTEEPVLNKHFSP